LPSRAGIADFSRSRQPVPDEQNHKRADSGGDEARALIEAVPTDGLSDESRNEGARYAEDSGQDEALRIVCTGRNQARDNAGNERSR
jgi:hypothetical protein